MNQVTWFGVLKLAEDYGWNPLGTAQPGRFETRLEADGYDPDSWLEEADSRLVLLEDALNLSDALERAFLAYEPEPAYPLFQYSASGPARMEGDLPPSIGVMTAVMDFCRLGEFRIEKHN